MATALETLNRSREERGSAKPKLKKAPIRKAPRDWSQPLRRTLQALFVVLNVLIGLQFFHFVRHFETWGQTPAASRPPGVEGWLPIAGLMNLKYFLLTGTVPTIHPAAMFLLAGFLVISFLFRKAFCSWLCPIGTISEALWQMGRKVLKRNWSLPRWLDLPLRSLKYILMALFLYAAASMSPAAIGSFMSAPYGLIADVKMLNFFRNMGETALAVITLLILLSVVIKNFWCRYLCPYGALMGLPSLASPARIRRDEGLCINCAKCTRVCPSLLPVDKLVTVKSAECTGCFECIAVCPVDKALVMSLPSRRKLPSWAMAAGIAGVFLGTVAYAKWAGTWKSPISESRYQELIPRAEEFHHF